MAIIVAIIVFGFLVFFHELGHFLLAKKNGIVVTEFSIGMGPRIVSHTMGGTKYSLKLFPFGGSCMLLGDDGESEDKNAFGNKSVWARISVIVAGAVFNFILAFLLAIIVISAAGYDSPTIIGVMEGYPAEQAGLQAGDVIQKINKERIHFDREVSLYMLLHPGEELTVTVDRNGTNMTVTFPQKQDEEGNYYMGIYRSSQRVKASPIEVLKYSFYEVKYQISTVFKTLGLLFRGRVTVNDFTGPVGIVNMVGDVVEGSTSNEVDIKTNIINVLLSVMNFAIMLSANLGVMNLLPIPALDGGRLVFLLIEAVRGKPVAREKEGMVHFVGMMLLMAFMVYVMFNDIRRIF